MKRNWIFILLLSMSALALAGTAAYFSVYGLTKLFYAAGIGITILAASLEFAKLVTVSYVYRFWKTIKRGLRGFYIFAVLFIMLLTSIGIYGFLTGAYQQSANKVQFRDAQITIAENKKSLFASQLDRVNETIKNSGDRIKTLSGLRSQQENRLDNLYNEKYLGVAQRTEKQITGSDDQIKLLNSDITEKIRQTTSINDSIGFYDQKIAELKSSDVSNEIGPYKFVADLTGLPIGKIVNIVAILIILVFDPLAIALLIGVNQLTMSNSPITEDTEKDNFISRLFKKKQNKQKSNDSSEESKLDENKITSSQNETSTTTQKIVEVVAIDPPMKVIALPEKFEEVKENKIEIVFEPESMNQTELIDDESSGESIEDYVVDSHVELSIVETSEPIIDSIIDSTEPEKKKEEIKPENEEIQSETEEIQSETEEIQSNEVESFLEVFENTEKKTEFETKRVPFVRGRVNVAHFVPKT